MSKVLELTRVLANRPEPVLAEGVRLRTFGEANDIRAWLDLRHRAFAREKLGVRAWGENDFQREFLDKPWWNPGRMWFAEGDGVIGSVTLARRDGGTASKPVVHWLMVDPHWRRRGVARLLLGTLEAVVWETGQRQIWLETHSAWAKADQFYRAIGYVETARV